MHSFRTIARGLTALVAVAGTATLTVTAATSQTRPPVPSWLVGLGNPKEANKVLATYGPAALWAYDSATGRFQSIVTFHPRPGQTQFTSGLHALDLKINLRRLGHGSWPSPVAKGSGTATTTSTASTTTTVAGSTESSSTSSSSASASVPSTPDISTAAADAAATGTAAPPSGYSSSQLIFQDTFSGSTIDSSNWQTYIADRNSDGYPWNDNGSGGSGLANTTEDYDEEYDLPSQLSVSNGLDITATETPTLGMFNSAPYTFPWRSGVVCSYGKFEFTGGYLQIVAKMPAGDGMWPALWMLPGSGAPSGPESEIDLFEGGSTGNGVSPNDNFSWHLHTPDGTFGGTSNVGIDLTSGYNVYGLQWVPGQSITWYLNGNVVGQVTSAQAAIPTVPMELIMDLEVADAATAGWHTVADASTPTTDQMLIRSVQVFS